MRLSDVLALSKGRYKPDQIGRLTTGPEYDWEEGSRERLILVKPWSEILEEGDHPFILKMYDLFKTGKIDPKIFADMLDDHDMPRAAEALRAYSYPPCKLCGCHSFWWGNHNQEVCTQHG